MKSALIMALAVAAAGALFVTPADAQWTRVTDLPVTDVFSVWSKGDTIVAGVDTATYVSLNAGQTWKRSVKVTTDVDAVEAPFFRNGRLYAGTFGQGVFVSDDLGDTWQGFNQGLVGGIANSQLDTGTLLSRGDSLYVSTFGAGVYVRGFAPGQQWSHFGEIFEPNQASNVDALVLGGARLLACGGANGMAFFRDPGAGEWTLTFLDNNGLSPNLGAYDAAWTGTGFIVTTNAGTFRSTQGQSPWTFTNLGLGALGQGTLAVRNGRVFGAFVHLSTTFILTSENDGATWQPLESQPGVFVYRMTVCGTNLFAGRLDGLWVRPIGLVDVPPPGARLRLDFALAGAQPVRDDVRFRFTLPEGGPVSIDVHDVRGRVVAAAVEGTYDAGPHVVSWNARSLGPGVYLAQLRAGDEMATLKFVRVRN